MDTLSYRELAARFKVIRPPEERPSPEFRVCERLQKFVPPTLGIQDEQHEAIATLISARGATGKSTLARQLSADTKLPLWSLENDKAVSGDALGMRLTSYLHVPDPMAAIKSGVLGGLIIDSMDEARLLVTGQSWEEFLSSLFDFANAGLHIVILGRVRTIEDVWLSFAADRGAMIRSCEISHFDREQQVEYVNLRALDESGVSTSAYESARDAVLNSLRNANDLSAGDEFVGYAPVLDAVSRLVADGENHKAVINDFGRSSSRSKRIEVLKHILDVLLQREQTKLELVAKDLGLDTERTYRPDEQLDWLAHEFLGGPPPDTDWCPMNVRSDYLEKLQGFREEHPFRSGRAWVSPVFASFVAARRVDTVDSVEFRRTGNQSGLLFEFMASAAEPNQLLIDEPRLAGLQASLIAGQWRGADATIGVDTTGGDELECVRARLSLVESHDVKRTLTADVLLETSGLLLLYGPLVNISAVFPATIRIRADDATSLNLGPDVFIKAHRVEFDASSLQISRGTEEGEEQFGVEIEVDQSFEANCSVSQNVQSSDFTIAVPDHVKLPYPWVSFRSELISEPTHGGDPRARRFLDKLMSLARRHGHGERAVFLMKLQGRQGLIDQDFQHALQALVDLGVVRVSADMVFINSEWEQYRYDGKGRPGMPSYDDHREVWEPVVIEISKRLSGT